MGGYYDEGRIRKLQRVLSHNKNRHGKILRNKKIIKMKINKKYTPDFVEIILRDSCKNPDVSFIDCMA